jgi:GNAT superfamily N-acetyltransferase
MSNNTTIDRKINIRVLNKSDLSLYCTDMESRNVDSPLSYAQLVEEKFKKRGRLGYLITVDDEAAGYVIYERSDDFLTIVRILIDKDYRREGLGTAIVKKLKSLNLNVDVWCPEAELAMQLMLKKNGFLSQPKPSAKHKGRQTVTKRRGDNGDEYYMIYMKE